MSRQYRWSLRAVPTCSLQQRLPNSLQRGEARRAILDRVAKIVAANIWRVGHLVVWTGIGKFALPCFYDINCCTNVD